MIPRLCDSNQTTIGWLADCVSCLVTEERNGIFEAEFQYPATGKWFDQITDGNIVMLPHDDTKVPQPFEIYRRSAPINGLVTFNAHHISYQLGHVILSPMTASTAAEAFATFLAHAYTSCVFEFWTDKTGTGTFKVEVPDSIKAVLGGQEGSILDVFGGGEYKWDNYTVRLYQNRGVDAGVTIRYGKNLTDIEQVRDTSGMYNSVIPYWTNGEETVIGSMVSIDGIASSTVPLTDHTGVAITDQNGTVIDAVAEEIKAVPMDLSDAFEEAPTQNQLMQKAKARLVASQAWLPNENIKIDFVALWQTEDYKDYAVLQRVNLCDIITVEYPALGISVKKKVIRTVYNTLLDKYDEIEVGESQVSFAETVTATVDRELDKMSGSLVTTSALQKAIDEATAAITGGAGGNFMIVYDANGKPIEVAWLDTGDINTAVNVWRWNGAGLAHSSHGYAGPFDDFAILANGAINASKITTGYLNAALIQTGTMLADRILGGTLKLGGSGNGNGSLAIYDSSNQIIGTINNSGANLTGSFHLKNILWSGAANGYASLLDFALENISSGSSSIFAEELRGLGSSVSGFGNSDYAVLQLHVTVPGTPSLIDEQSIFFVPTTMGGIVMTRTSRNSVNAIFNKVRCDVHDYNYYHSATGRTFSGRIRSYDYLDEAGARKTIYDTSTGTQGTLRLDIATETQNGSSVVTRTPGITYSESSQSNPIIQFTPDIHKWMGQWLALQSSSSRRYKHSIRSISQALDPHKLLDLPVREFIYNEDQPLQYPDMEGQTIPGFIAEEVEEIYPAAVIHDPETGKVESWDERRIIPGMLALIQEQQKTIKSLITRIERLEVLLNADT